MDFSEEREELQPKSRNSPELQKILNERKTEKRHNRKRMEVKERDFISVRNIVTRWGDAEAGSLETDRYDDYMALWEWLEKRAQEEGVSMTKMPVTAGALRLSLEYIRVVWNDEMAQMTDREHRERCKVQMDDYLQWYDSRMCEFVKRCETSIEENRLKSLYHVVRDKLKNGILNGDKKAIQQWLEATGRNKGEKEKDGPPEIFVAEFDAQGRPIKSEKVIPMKRKRKGNDADSPEPEAKTDLRG